MPSLAASWPLCDLEPALATVLHAPDSVGSSGWVAAAGISGGCVLLRNQGSHMPPEPLGLRSVMWEWG